MPSARIDCCRTYCNHTGLSVLASSLNVGSRFYTDALSKCFHRRPLISYASGHVSSIQRPDSPPCPRRDGAGTIVKNHGKWKEPCDGPPSSR
ncbi:hypothetical protein AB1N83_012826 [Pleurotus pulmonarius]